jgi:hypothetical protein
MVSTRRDDGVQALNSPNLIGETTLNVLEPGGDYFRRILHGALSSDCKDGPNQLIFLTSPHRVE